MVLKELFGVSYISIYCEQNEPALFTSIPDVTLPDVESIKGELEQYRTPLEYDMMLGTSKHLSKLKPIAELIESSKYCYSLKLKRTEGKILLYFFHIDDEESRMMFENPSISESIDAMMIKYADLLFEDHKKAALTRVQFIAVICGFLDIIGENPYTFLYTSLLHILQTETGSRIIWVNDLTRLPQYSKISKIIFVGLHEKTHSPFILNYAAKPEFMELNFRVDLTDKRFRSCGLRSRAGF
jgi:hypothetical protein